MGEEVVMVGVVKMEGVVGVVRFVVVVVRFEEVGVRFVVQKVVVVKCVVEVVLRLV